ncbi:MAG: PHP domain-containing protein, partial [Candidatus Bathyarchaeia archaeon]
MFNIKVLRESMEFVHLHVHTSYSPLEGADRIESILMAAEKMRFHAVAITDTNGLYGVPSFYRNALDKGIKPILGVEILEKRPLLKGSSHRKNRGRAISGLSQRAVLLAKNRRGYTNLCRIVTERHLSDRFDLVETLCRWGSDLFVLARDPHLLERLRGSVEKDSLFCEIILTGEPWKREEIREVLSTARRLRIPPVATNDVHFIEPSGYMIHRVLSAIRTRSTVATVPGDVLAHEQAWLMPPAMMALLFKEIPEAIGNTRLIAEACEVELELGKVKFPP